MVWKCTCGGILRKKLLICQVSGEKINNPYSGVYWYNTYLVYIDMMLAGWECEEEWPSSGCYGNYNQVTTQCHPSIYDLKSYIANFINTSYDTQPI